MSLALANAVCCLGAERALTMLQLSAEQESSFATIGRQRKHDRSLSGMQPLSCLPLFRLTAGSAVHGRRMMKCFFNDLLPGRRFIIRCQRFQDESRICSTTRHERSLTLLCVSVALWSVACAFQHFSSYRYDAKENSRKLFLFAMKDLYESFGEDLRFRRKKIKTQKFVKLVNKFAKTFRERFSKKFDDFCNIRLIIRLLSDRCVFSVHTVYTKFVEKIIGLT